MRIAVSTVALMAAALFMFTVVLASGKGGDWALPVLLTVVAALAIIGFVCLVRVQRAERRDHRPPS